MILEKMLHRLFSGLASGPGLNARPQNSRQRIDLMELEALGGVSPESTLTALLGATGSMEFPARIPAFRPPERPVEEWTPGQRAARTAFDRQTRLLGKLRDMVADATDYLNDHGEPALFVGYPLLSIPPGNHTRKLTSGRILAPVLLSPVNLKVRRDARAGLSISAAGGGSDLVVPNPALMAWLEQHTGEDTDELFANSNGEDAWREIRDILTWACRAIGIEPVPFGADTRLEAVPRTDALPSKPCILPAAVLGLFPLSNPGLLRDTKWMMANESALEAPVKNFLSARAIEEVREAPVPEAGEWDAVARTAVKDFGDERLITQSDPCQSEAVALARTSEALVVYGPPGTGKSQTIANIIGDHLARNQRVLFVCDKRTALDVVKFRLDSMGLGHLCGVIHDPARDRRDFYMGLRERLEELANGPRREPDNQEHYRLSSRMNELHTELHACFRKLHGSENGSRSFHELTGAWFRLVANGAGSLIPDEGLSVAMVESHRADAEEILRRGVLAKWPSNPFRGKLEITLDDFLAIPPQAMAQRFANLSPSALAADSVPEGRIIPLDASLPPAAQAAFRRQLADLLETAQKTASSDLRAAYSSPHKRRLIEQHKPTGPEKLEAGLDRELVLQMGGQMPGLAEVNRRLLSIDAYLPLLGSWKAIFFAGKKRQAAAALEPLALPMTMDALQRARNFYEGLKTRLGLADLMNRVYASRADALPGDPELIAFCEGIRALDALYGLADHAGAASLWGEVESALANPDKNAGAWLENLRRSAERAEALAAFRVELEALGICSETAIDALIADLCGDRSARELADDFQQFQPLLEESARLSCRLREMPAPLAGALNELLGRGMDWSGAEPELMAAALSREIRERIRTDADIARIDTARVESAFAELTDRTAEKQMLVRRLIVDHWTEKARFRLVASTGNRLNPLGASLKQRLFIRGKRALRLRQMLAVGADAEGGDPIFDLCPVWMASPSTVAQIFPHEAVFDVVVFDEASQCRLEEALPVLLRGRRVVIAGDPKQLPPTRFFEQALADSDETSAETMDEVFEQQQSEAEDLLSAALNLDVQEAFLDVHYRSRDESLIGFSNGAFYSGRLQPVPSHPSTGSKQPPVRLIRVDGIYEDRGNRAEAGAAANLAAELLASPKPPSIGIACFNVTQRDLILDALEQKALEDPNFAGQLEIARARRGADSFEGLFVKNLENVQGDERDHMIICTTFGLNPGGTFRRNFGALSRVGGERRLNVLITRAREAIHILTSIPRTEYLAEEESGEGQSSGRHYLYGYLRYAEGLATRFEKQKVESSEPRCRIEATAAPSGIAEGLGQALFRGESIGSTVYWGNEGFCVDDALMDSADSSGVTLGVLTDFTRYRKTPDPILWEQFRTSILRAKGWQFVRVWSPALYRDSEKILAKIVGEHRRMSG